MKPSVLTHLKLKTAGIKRAAICFAAFLAVGAVSPVTAQAKSGGRVLQDSYTYNYWGNAVPSPNPYDFAGLFTGNVIGCGDFGELSDLFVDSEGCLYVADALKNRIVKIGADMSFIREYTEVSEGEGKLKSPSGIFIDEDLNIYVSDTGNGRIVKLNQAGETLQVYGKPEDRSLPDDFRFLPQKIVVDNAGRIYVTANAINQGIVTINQDGSFAGFLAAAKVNPDAMQVLWKRLATDEQRRRMSNFVPVEYRSLTIDDEGFIYATVASVKSQTVISDVDARLGTEEGSLVRRLNMNGQDILRRNGYFPPVGDVYNLSDQTVMYKGISEFSDVCSYKYGCYFVLDNNRKRVFAYDGDGFLLFAFGFPDAASGGFVTPLAFAVQDDMMYVADSGTLSISVFKMTEYAESIYQAINLYASGRYAESEAEWQKTIERNAGLELAYCGMGKAAYRDGRYAEAMEYFQLGNNKEFYSKAFEKNRVTAIKTFFPVVAVVLLFLFAASVVRQAYIYFSKLRKGELRE